MKQNLLYWKKNIRLIIVCLTMWFSISYGAGILFVEPLNRIHIGGYKLGFWFSQQGALFGFIAIIFFYCWRMNKLDQTFNAT